MARIRTVKPEFWTSEQVVDCSPLARLLFIGMWNFCDDSGIHPASVKRLKMEVYPGDDIDSESIRLLIDELIENGLVIQYAVENKEFWKINGWHHQKIDKPTYKYPLPDGTYPIGARRPLDESSPPEGKGREGKGSKFTPPTVEEVTAYCQERGNTINPQTFVDHYEANGWMRGKNKIKSWKACVRTWEQNRPKQSTGFEDAL